MNRGCSFYRINNIRKHTVTGKTHLDKLRIMPYIATIKELLRFILPCFTDIASMIITRRLFLIRFGVFPEAHGLS